MPMKNIVGYLLKEPLNVMNRPLVATERGNVVGELQVKLLFSVSSICESKLLIKNFNSNLRRKFK